MAMPMYKIRIIANACITRYERGEGTMYEIVYSYNMTEEDRTLVIDEITKKQPDVEITAPEEEPTSGEEPTEPIE